MVRDMPFRLNAVCHCTAKPIGISTRCHQGFETGGAGSHSGSGLSSFQYPVRSQKGPLAHTDNLHEVIDHTGEGWGWGDTREDEGKKETGRLRHAQ